MSSLDDDREVARFVAGLPTDESALTRAILARAVDRAIVVGMLLGGLDAADGATRLATARRIARMPRIAPLVAARLARGEHEDDDGAVRAACVAALRAHARATPLRRGLTPPTHEGAR